jgi:hypothetical protein
MDGKGLGSCPVASCCMDNVESLLLDSPVQIPSL